MIEITFTNLLLINAIAFIIADLEGPFGIFSKIRNKILLNKIVGVFFYKLLSCYFCIGFWCGIIVFFINGPIYSFIPMILYGLIGSIWSLLVSKIILRR